MIDNIRLLARQVRDRHKEGDPPFTIFLGLGASMAPGALVSNKVIENLPPIDFSPPLESLSDIEPIEASFKLLDNSGVDERDKILSQYLIGLAPSAGYQHLANLIVRGYFRTLITTGFDTFLEQELYDAGLWSRDLRIICLQRDDFPQTKRRGKAKVDLFKLRGDPYSADFWDTWEDLGCPPSIEKQITEAMTGDLIMVGYHPRDAIITPFLNNGDGQLVYVNTERPDVGQPLPSAIQNRMDLVISGEYSNFDNFFGTLADLLLYRSVQGDTTQDLDVVSSPETGVQISKQGFGRSLARVDDASATDDEGRSRETAAQYDPITESELQDPDAERLKSLRSQMEALFENYYSLEKQAAIYGAGNVPLSFQNRIDSVMAEISALSAEIDHLSNKEG
jgi:hypothetical protein